MGIICPPAWDRINWFAKIWGCHGRHPRHLQGRHPCGLALIYCWGPFLFTYSYLVAYKNWHVMSHLQTRDTYHTTDVLAGKSISQISAFFFPWKSPTTYPSFGPSLGFLDGNEIFNWKMAQCYSLMNMRQLHILFNSAKTWHVIVCWFLCFTLNLPELS